MPLSMHILTGRRGTGIDFFASDLMMRAATLHHEVERSIVVFVFGGVLERFPGLKIVSAENDAAWMPYLMWRMDMIYGRGFASAPVRLKLKPSEYIQRQVYATFINEPVFVDGLHRYGPDNIMWSSDYPHTSASGRACGSLSTRPLAASQKTAGARSFTTPPRGIMGWTSKSDLLSGFPPLIILLADPEPLIGWLRPPARPFSGESHCLGNWRWGIVGRPRCAIKFAR
jgi:hypothetical protein